MAKNVTTVSLVVFRVLLIAVVALNSKWGWNAQDHVAVPMVNASWSLLESAASGNNGPIQITVEPLYIILEVRPGVARQGRAENQIRITTQTMSGFYSEYVASRPSAPAAMSVLFVGSPNSGTLGWTQWDLAVWE